MKPFRRCWNVPAEHASWVVVDALDLEPGEEPRVVPETIVESRVARWAREPSTCRALLEMSEAVVSSSTHRPPTEELIHAAVDVVQAAFRRGRLVAIEEPLQAVAEAVGEAAPPAEASPAQRGIRLEPRRVPQPGTQTDWVQIAVEDQDGKALSGRRVRLTFTDQTTRDFGTSDAGVVYVDQIPPGQCKVELPGLDADTWSLKT